MSHCDKLFLAASAGLVFGCLTISPSSAQGVSRKPIDWEACYARVRQVMTEKEQMDRLFYDRIVRASGSQDHTVQCLLYKTWDGMLNEVIVELDRCYEPSDAVAISVESAELGAAMTDLRCRQVELPAAPHGSAPPPEQEQAPATDVEVAEQRPGPR